MWGVGVVCQEPWQELFGHVAGVPSSGRRGHFCQKVLCSPQVEILPWKRKLSEA